MIIPKEDIKKYEALVKACALLSEKFPQNTLDSLEKKTEYMINLVLGKICTTTQRYIPLNSEEAHSRYSSKQALGINYQGVVYINSTYRGPENAIRVQKPYGSWLKYFYTSEVEDNLLKLVKCNARASKITDLKQFILDLYSLPTIKDSESLDHLKTTKLMTFNIPECFSSQPDITHSLELTPARYVYSGICSLHLESGKTINLSNISIEEYILISEPDLYNAIMELIQQQIKKYDTYIAPVLQSYTKFFETYSHYLAMKKLSLKTYVEKQTYTQVWGEE